MGGNGVGAEMMSELMDSPLGICSNVPLIVSKVRTMNLESVTVYHLPYLLFSE